MAILTGSFTSAGVSAAFTPAPNAPFGVMLDGGGTGWICLLTQSVGGGAYALMFNLDGSPVRFFAAGETIINPPFTAPLTQPPLAMSLCAARLAAAR